MVWGKVMNLSIFYAALRFHCGFRHKELIDFTILKRVFLCAPPVLPPQILGLDQWKHIRYSFRRHYECHTFDFVFPPRSCRQLQISKVCPAPSTSKNRSAHTITKSSNKASIDNHVAHPLRTNDIITARPQRASALKNLCLHNRHLCAADWSAATSRTPSAGPKTGFPTHIEINR